MPKIVDHDKKREEFLLASREVIAEEGLNAATLRRVSAQAGCTTGSLTRYFSDRNTLVIETLRLAHFATASRMRVAAEEAVSDFDRLEQVLLESLPLDEKRLLEWRVWLAFWGATNGEAELLTENAARYHEWQDALVTLLEPLLPSKALVEEEAYNLRALIDGFGLGIALSGNNKRRLSESQKRCKKQLTAYIRRFKN